MDATYSLALLKLARKVNLPPVDPELVLALSQLEPRHLRGYPGSQQGQRGMVADLLEEHGHKDQADLLRDEEHPVEVHDGRVHSALWKTLLRDPFLSSYVDTAFELGRDAHHPHEDTFADAGAGWDEVHPDTLREMVGDANGFRERLPGYLRKQVDAEPYHSGMNLFFDQNQVGRGFHSSDKYAHGNRLTAHAEQLGPYSLYRGTDGMIHGQRA